MNRTATPVDPPAPGGPTGHGHAGATAWEDLVTTALLGTDRRPPPVSLPAPGREAPAALLDAAAAETVRRRAGLRPARAAPARTRPPRTPARPSPPPRPAGSPCCWPTGPARPAAAAEARHRT
ncbi:hypothetical protein GCM10020295_31430 [Streptomyces cinereospinus]